MNALIFDTETTGLFKFFHKQHTTPEQMRPYPWVIEFFGHIIADDDSATAEEDFFCKPGVAVTEEITRITGIKPEDVADAQPFADHADRVLGLLRQADAIVAHNLSYDLRILEVAFKRVGRWDEANTFLQPLRKICTVEQSMHYKGHRLSLTMLHQHLFGTPFEGAHRARADVEALTRCFVEMRKKGDI